MITETSVQNALDNDAWLRVWRDIIKRTSPGIFLYPAFWVAIVFSSGFHASHSVLTWSVASFLVSVSFLRLINALIFPRLVKANRTIWQFFFYAGVLAHSSAYGSMFAYSLISDNSQFNLLMAFSGAGMVAGGVNSFSPRRSLAYSYAIIFLLPSIAVCLWSEGMWAEAGLITTYLFYMWNLVRQQNSEYWISLNNEKMLEQQSRTDALTTLNNRRYFDEKLSELCHLSSRDHVYLSVLVIDCDNFKTINDQYGHDFGDECLKKIAAVLSNNLPRATDVCARYGGEEFSIILAGTDLAGAEIVAERIRLDVEKMPIEHNGQTTHVTISIGLVAAKLDSYQVGLPERLFKYADEALFLAKERGRNQVVSSDASSVLPAAKSGLVP